MVWGDFTTRRLTSIIVTICDNISVRRRDFSVVYIARILCQVIIVVTGFNNNSSTGNSVDCVVRFFACTAGGSRHAMRRGADLLPTLIAMGCGPGGQSPAPSSIQSIGNGRWLFAELWGSLSPSKLVLRESDRLHLPESEDGGVIGPLPLSPTSGIISSTYGVLFPEGILGTLSLDGPAVSRLATYMKSSGDARLSGLRIEPLIDTDVAARVLNSQSLGYIDIQMHPSQLPHLLPEAGKVKDALEYQIKLWSEQKSLRFYLEPSVTSSSRAMNEYRSPLESLIETWVPLVSKGSKFKVKCSRLVENTLRYVVVDVLSGKLTTEKTVPYKGVRTSGLDESSAFAAIVEAYDDLEADIHASIQSSGRR